MRKGDNRTQEDRIPFPAVRAHQVGRHQCFSMPGGERMQAAQRQGKQECSCQE